MKETDKDKERLLKIERFQKRYVALLGLNIETIAEVTKSVIFAVETLNKQEVDSHVLLRIAADATKKLDAIGKEWKDDDKSR